MTPTPDSNDPREALRQLGLWGLLASWDQVRSAPWLNDLITFERAERQRRSLERRLRSACIGSFKPLADFDWHWPKKIERSVIDELCTLDFIAEQSNVVLVGPNGCGKTMIAKNLAHLALLAGHSVRFVSASAMLADLASCESSASLERRFGRYRRPALLVIDELGYLSYDARFADLLFEVISRRYLRASTLITTNKAFKEWGEVFPNATTVVTIVDRLIHKADVTTIEAESYRLKEAMERTAAKAAARKQRTKTREAGQ